MTNKEAATILRDLCRLALPTVNGIPFPEIKKAIILGAEALDPTPKRNCAECRYRKAMRTETGTSWGCSIWECDFTPIVKYTKKELEALRKYNEEKESAEADAEARREAMRLDDNEDTLKWKGTH